MKFLICPTSQDQLEYGGNEGLFRGSNNKYFNYAVEFEHNDFVRITDSVGRIMPMDISEVRDFADMLGRIADYHEHMELAKDYAMADLCYGADQ
jgi:hypothetical protein